MMELRWKFKKLLARLRGSDYVLALELQRLQASGVVEWGTGSYGLPRIETFDSDHTRLIVGKYCSIGGGVTFILGGNHPTNRLVTFPVHLRFGLSGVNETGFPSSKGDIVVGNDVWVGRGAMLISGVSIGDGAVIAAGSVVTRDVEPYSVVAGNPARHVKWRTSEDLRKRLRKVAWWDWSEDQVAGSVRLLSSEITETSICELEQEGRFAD